MNLTLANPRGFCAGVDRAIEIVNRALEVFGAPVYVRHEVVHNKFVVNDLKSRGAIFIDEVDQAPDDCILIFSAHGVSKQVRKNALSRQLKLFDATCPLVTKVHLEVARYSRDGIYCVLIGHKGHPEVDGTLGQYDNSNGGQIFLVENSDDVLKLPLTSQHNIAFVSQTTLSMDDTAAIIETLKQAFPNIHGPKKHDICYATQNRQDAVKRISLTTDTVFVVGSQNSSNSTRLKEVAEKQGATAYLIDTADEIDQAMLATANNIGLTAGASAPEHLVQQVREKLAKLGARNITEDDGEREDIVFNLPNELKKSP